MKYSVPTVGKAFSLVCQGEKLSFRSPEWGVLLVPVKDASRTFGLLGVLDLPGIRWLRVHWFWIGHWVSHIDGLKDHIALKKTGTGDMLARTTIAQRPLDILGFPMCLGKKRKAENFSSPHTL